MRRAGDDDDDVDDDDGHRGAWYRRVHNSRRETKERERGTGYDGREERKEERMSELVECGRKRRKGLPLPWWRKG